MIWIPSGPAQALVPDPPTVLASNPDSPANDNNPEITGIAQAGSNVRLYSDSACTVLLASGTAQDFTATGITINVTDDTTTTLYGTATDEADDTSSCSSSFVTYVEDSTAPPPPSDLATPAVCPSNDNYPEITGTAEAGSTVSLFSDHWCTTLLASGSAELFAGAGISIYLDSNTTSNIYANATDIAGNTSACNTRPLTYREDSAVRQRTSHLGYDEQKVIGSAAHNRNEKFGSHTAITGNTALIGADDWGCLSQGPGKPQICGFAYIYTRKDIFNPWVERQLVGSGFDSGLGADKLALSENTVLVPAVSDEIAHCPDAECPVVVAYIPDAGGNWVEQGLITPDDQAPVIAFPTAIEIHQDTVLVGDHNQACGDGPLCGAAYVFNRDAGGDWTEQQRLTASDATDWTFFGGHVALSNDTLLVDTNPNAADAGGSVYVFTQNELGTWIERQKLSGSDSDTSSVGSMAIGDHTLVIGHPGADCIEDTNCGAVYVFERNESGTWIEEQKLTGSDSKNGDSFGYAVALDGDTVLIGAPSATCPASSDCGAAYVFSLNESGTWIETQKLTGSDSANRDAFGISVALSEHTFLVGAANQDKSCDAEVNCGAGYIYTRAPIFRDSYEIRIDETSVADPALQCCITDKAVQEGLESVVQVKELDCNNRGIKSLEGLESFTQLEVLNVNRNQITDISPLQDVTGLSRLVIYENPVDSIAPLANLKELTILDINATSISSLEPIRDHQKIWWLTAGDTPVSDISPVQNFPVLIVLNIANTQVSDLSAVENLTTLRALELGNLGLEDADIWPLEFLIQLRRLTLNGNDISNISHVQNMSNLDLLWLHDNNITDISAVTNLDNMTILDMPGNLVSDLTPLQNMVSLDFLSLTRNRVSDITPLLGLTGLSALHLWEQENPPGLNCAQQQAIVATLSPPTFVGVDGFWNDPDDEPDQGNINCFP